MASSEPFSSVVWNESEPSDSIHLGHPLGAEDGTTHSLGPELAQDKLEVSEPEENTLAGPAQVEPWLNQGEATSPDGTAAINSGLDYEHDANSEELVEDFSAQLDTAAAYNRASGSDSSLNQYTTTAHSSSPGHVAQHPVPEFDALSPYSLPGAAERSASPLPALLAQSPSPKPETQNTKPLTPQRLEEPAPQQAVVTREQDKVASPQYASAKPASSSAIDEQLMVEQFFKYSIVLAVSNPLSDRDANLKAYISYLVTTTTTHPDIKRLSTQGDAESVTVKVRRRYGDFRFLHDCLHSDFPQVLIPPLPPKLNFKYLTGDTFSSSFVHKRLHSLDRFVAFICQHKLLLQLSVFHYFVSDSLEWVAFTKTLRIAKGDEEPGVVSKVVNEDLLTETIMNFFTSSKHKRETNKEILEISDKLKKVYENLLKLDRIFARLNKKNNDLKSDYELFLLQINKLAPTLNGAAPPTPQDSALPETANSAENNNLTPVANNFRQFADSLMFFSENWGNLARYIDESFLVALRDCAKYIARLSELIELHHNKKIDLQVLHEYLAKAKAEMVAMDGGLGSSGPPSAALIGQGSGGFVNNTTQLIKDTLSTSATPHISSSQTDNKKARLQQKIEQLESEISLQTALVKSLSDRIINEEYPNWDRFNKLQLKQAMVDLCDHEISFYKGLVDRWTDVEAKLSQRLSEIED